MKKCELSIPGETRIALGVNEANRLHKYATAQAEMAALAGKHAVLARAAAWQAIERFEGCHRPR